MTNDELVERKAEPVQPEYGYMRIVEVFDRNETAGAFLSEDGEGGFAAGVSRMADEIDRLRAALSAAPEPVTVEGGGNAVPQTLDEIIENSLRMWYFNYDPSLDHTAARIAMREIIRYVIDVARVSPASPSPVDSRDALDELEKARAEQWRLRREAEGSRDAARAAADSLRIERDTLRAAIEPFAKLYSEIPEDNFWPSEEYRNLGVAAEAYALSASPSPVGDRDALIERLQQIHDEQRSILGQMLLDKSEEGQRASNWQGGKVNGIASAIAALAAKEQQP